MALTLKSTTDLPTGLELSVFEQALEQVLDHTDSTDEHGWLNLAFVDEPTARRLNQQFADHDYATDVLSFDYFEGEQSAATAQDERGEIVICLPVAAKQAKEHGTSLHDELVLLFVHACLHLLGHDHGGPKQAGFAALQSAIMSELTDAPREFFDGNNY